MCLSPRPDRIWICDLLPISGLHIIRLAEAIRRTTSEHPLMTRHKGYTIVADAGPSLPRGVELMAPSPGPGSTVPSALPSAYRRAVNMLVVLYWKALGTHQQQIASELDGKGWGIFNIGWKRVGALRDHLCLLRPEDLYAHYECLGPSSRLTSASKFRGGFTVRLR
jgi:hypothetical protein